VNDNQENNPPAGKADRPLAMNRQQVEVFELLEGLSREREEFHQWYAGAIQVLASNSSDKIAQAANSIRELCEKLATRLNVEDFQSPLPPLKDLLQIFPQVKASAYSDGWTGNLINKKLNDFLVDLEEKVKLFDKTPRTSRLKVALTTSDPQAEFMSKEYREARDQAFGRIGKFFENVAHHRHKADEFEFNEVLNLFESLLLNYLTPCTASQQDELKALIANGPTPENLKRVNALISNKGANFIFFFENLDNPEWLQPLEQQGHFTNLPGPEPLKDGQFAHRAHVPLVSLTKLAETAPKEVTSILEKLKLPDNARVGDQVLQCMAKIRDASCIPRLRPLVQQLSENPSRTSWLWIQELLANWITLGAIPDALVIAEGFLIAAVEVSFNKSEGHHNDWLTKQIDEQVLGGLTGQCPFEVANMVCKVLNRWTQLNRRKDSKSDYWENFSSAYWLVDFNTLPRHFRELEGTLAIRLFKAGTEVCRRSGSEKFAELDQALRKNQSALFARLRWQLYADFPAKTLELARRDVIAQIPRMNRASCGHSYEFAQMLDAQTKLHGAAFLSANEVSLFVETIFSGPLDVNGVLMEGYEKEFRHKQLWPISALLNGNELELYQAIETGGDEIKLKSYRRSDFGGEARMIEHVSPKQVDDLAAMTLPELWIYLDTYQPKGRAWPEWWIEESFDALAEKFAEYVERRPERFNSDDAWWKQLKRPALLYKILDRFSKLIQKEPESGVSIVPQPTEREWANWFGVAKWVASQRPIMGKKDNDELDWAWARIVAATFLQAALRSKHQVPEVYLPDVKALLEDLIREEDSRLDNRDTAGMGDWLTTAINSARGDALEALLQLALNQKNAGKDIEPWIFEMIRVRLELPTESPAVFALLGSKLRFLIHLFESKLRETPTLLFPPDRPLHQRAAIVAHFSYDHPWNKILKIFPELMNAALKTLEAMRAETKDKEAKEERRDFGSQLGIHIACYCWSGSFIDDAEGEKTLDRFFANASKSTRAMVISQIATVWEKPSDEKPDQNAIVRVMRIWERRSSDIVKALKGRDASVSTYEKELGAFTHWLGCECFPFEWRIANIKNVLDQLPKTPEAIHLFEAIYKYGMQAERLEFILQLLRLMLAKPSDQLRWSIQSEKLRPVISLGLASETPNTKKLAEECKDLLLRNGLF
jgi:hypothetical protein